MLLVLAVVATIASTAPPTNTAVSGESGQVGLTDLAGAPSAVNSAGDAQADAALAVPTSGDASPDAGGQGGALVGPVSGPSQPGQPPTPAGEPPKADDVPGEWIVELEPGTSPTDVAADHEASEGAEVHQVYTAALDGYAATMSDAEAEEVAGDPRVARVTRDRMVYAAVQSTPPGVPRSEALNIAPAVSGGSSVDADIAILDTGIDANHPDLNYRAGKNCISTSNAPVDDHGHGTHVAGTAAALNNSSDVVGVAPGARVWAVKVLNSSGSGTTAQIICGLNWVAANASTIDVVNMSLGGSGSDSSCGGSDSYHNAFCNVVNSGVPIVVAAGNNNRNSSGYVPATYNEVITVSAYSDFDGKPGALGGSKCSDSDDTFAYFSNYGSDVDLTAPGVCVVSTRQGGGTTSMSGTSMATPHVAGAVAAYIAKHGKASPTTIKSALQNNGTLDWSGDRDSTKEKALNLRFLGGTGLSSGSDGATTTTTSSSSTSSTSTSSTSSTTSTSTTTTTTAAPSSISLTVTRQSSWWRGAYALLQWSGASGSNVEIWRGTSSTSQSLVSTTSNDGSQSNSPGGGTWYYKVCNVGGSVCSPVHSITI